MSSRVAERNLASGRETATSGVESAPAAALLSLRRAPAALAAEETHQRYRFLLRDVIAGVDSSSCFSVALDGDGPVLEIGADRPVVPASNLKLVTAAVGLEVLGEDYVFTTPVQGEVQGDTVVGDLYLVGGGDATLSTAGYPESLKYQVPVQPYTDLGRLADDVRASGVTRVTGRVVGDESRYDTERYVGQWQQDIARKEAGPLSALLVNDGLTAPGDQIPSDDAPALHAAESFLRLLEERGVQVDGGAAVGEAPPGTPVLGSISSVPLGGVLAEMLATSDDNTAELLLKEIGLQRAGEGSTAAGVGVVRDVISSWGIRLDGLSIIDGSGLADSNRLTCDALMIVLERFGPSGPLADALAVAGRSGTLRDSEFSGTPVEGLLRAKTGTLSGARALSGYVAGSSAGVTFSLIINGADASPRAAPLWRALGRELGTVPPALDPRDLGPGA